MIIGDSLVEVVVGGGVSEKEDTGELRKLQNESL